MMSDLDNTNYNELVKSLRKTNNKLKFEHNDRDTESLYRFGWFYINDYKYSISGWSFRKKIVTFEDELGNKVKFSVANRLTFGGDFKKDGIVVGIKKKFRNGIANWLKDISDKLRT